MVVCVVLYFQARQGKGSERCEQNLMAERQDYTHVGPEHANYGGKFPRV